MKLTIEIPNEDFVYPDKTPQEQVEHLFNLHNIRVIVTPAEPSFREVMEWAKTYKCTKSIDCEDCIHDEICTLQGFFNGDVSMIDTNQILELFKQENNKNVPIRL